MVSIDFQKAYDFVSRDGMFYKMIRMHMGSRILRVVHNMYTSVESVVQLGVSYSDVLRQLVGLRQGCILSPSLFSLYISDLPKFLEARKGNERCEGVKLGEGQVVRVLMYADDLALVASSAEDLQRMLEALHDYAAKWHLIVNTLKTKAMVFNRCYTGRRSKEVAETQRTNLREKYIFKYNGNTIDIL